MKKLLIIPAVLLLASCGSNGGATGLSTSAPASTGQSTSKTTPAGPTITDITLNVTVSGIDTYEGGHSHIWINCDALGTSSEWGSEVLVQDTTDANKWSIVFEDFELEQSITYNLYYGTETSPDWTNGKNVSESENLTLVTEEGITSYDLAAEFYVPSSTGKINLKFSVSPLIMETVDAAGKNISEGNYIWAWNNLDNTTVKLEKDTDDSWYFAKEDVDLLDGKVSIQLTCVIGSVYSADWNYKQGAWEAGAWVPYGDGKPGLIFDFTGTETTHLESIYFQGEPEPVEGATVTINYFESAETTLWANSHWLEASYTKTNSGELNDFWPGNLTWNESTNGYSNTYLYTEGVFYFNIGLWVSDSSPKAFVGASLEKAFKVTLTEETASLTITATIADSGENPILLVGVASDCVGCTVE